MFENKVLKFIVSTKLSINSKKLQIVQWVQLVYDTSVL